MQPQRKQKINIKAFKPAAQIDANYADALWSVLATAFDQIYNKNASNLSFEELYRNAYNMVLYKHGERLYNGVKDVISDRLKNQARIVAETVEDEQFLTELRRKWEDHCVFMTMFRDILMYMDRTFVPQRKVLSVYDLGLVLFRDYVARHDRIRPRLRKIVLGTILRERLGETIDRSAMRDVIKMLLDLGVNSRAVYEEDFEKAFLEESVVFYKRESGHFISSNTCSEYLQKAARRLEEEVQRVEQYMDAATENKIREVVEHEMIAVHMQTLLHMEKSGLVWMVRNDQHQDLHRMFALFRRVPRGLQQIQDVMCTDLEETGTQFVNDAERCRQPEMFVQGLLDMKRKYDAIIKQSFRDEPSMRKAVDETFTKFLNKNKHSPEFLSLYIDEVLRKGVKGMSDEEMDRLLEDILTLFQFLEDKDVFERYYKTHLAKRLLLGRSASDDAERSMISKLKTECGYQFTNKLEGMFNDIKLSAETMENFKKFVAQRKLELHGITLDVKVLTEGYWPTQPIPSCTFPPQIIDCCTAFKDFYLSTHSGRKLSWQASMGSADIKANFRKKRCELNVSTFQMAILLLFNKEDRLTIHEIREATQISEPELTRHLLSLCSPKLPILQRREQRVSDNTVIEYNPNFTVKLFRIKVPLLREERDLTAPPVPADVLADRRMVIDAAVVRIMKARKRLEHSNLVAEVFKQLQTRFHPEPIDIKRRIENLIEREYLERAPEDRRIYQYLA